jgi:hypothetical protein
MAKTPKHPRYKFLKDGSYYFSRAVPKDLQHHYKTQRIVQSLKTKYRNQAAIASMEAYPMGVSHFILKPIHFDVVGRVIQEIINFHHRNEGMHVMLDQHTPVFKDFKSDEMQRMS